MATSLMKETFKSKGIVTIEELRGLSIEAKCQLMAIFFAQCLVNIAGFNNIIILSGVLAMSRLLKGDMEASVN
ncbi:MAG: hypothetical protein MI685_04285 [Chlorobiales bacterium]|nr:hypothetical protein [Chlorobiales bacterium]